MFKNISGLVPIRPLKIHLATPTLSMKTSYCKSRRGIQLEVGVESYGLQDLLSKHPKRVKRTQHLLRKINQLGLGVLQLASVGAKFAKQNDIGKILDGCHAFKVYQLVGLFFGNRVQQNLLPAKIAKIEFNILDFLPKISSEMDKKGSQVQ